MLLVLIAATFPGKATGEKLYRFRDQDGVLRFSDHPPATDQPVAVEQVRIVERDNRVVVTNVGPKEKPVVSIWNGYGGPVQVAFDFLKMENIATEPAMPARFVVKPQTRSTIIRIWPKNGARKWTYQYQYRVCPGVPNAVHSPPGPYGVPFSGDAPCPVSQGFNGAFSHNTPDSQYAIDIALPVGTPICAAREGVIMDIADDFFTGGKDRAAYAKRANSVRIVHDDGTMAVYAHLKLESVRFGIGRRVAAGAVIAESGNTGFSTGPHLHFVIQKNRDMQMVSVPFVIAGPGGATVTPQVGMMLRGRHDAVDGGDIMN